MVHVVFDGSSVSLQNFFQTGSGFSYFEGAPLYQRGYGYYAVNRQRGDGLGSIFRSLWRFLKPVAAKLAPVAANASRAIGQEGLATGARIMNELTQGGDLKEIVINQGKEGVKNLLDRASQKLQKGSGRKRKLRAFVKPGIIFKPNDVVGKFIPKKAHIKKSIKRTKTDILGQY